MALYTFARLVDDIGDEAPANERLPLLDLVATDVTRIRRGSAPRLEVLRELGQTVAELDIPADPFLALVEANRRDQRVTRYSSYSELLDYCRLSANPVGHLVLYLFGAATPERMRLSDRVCTGLQLVEHWQDVAEDLGKGRVYLPREDLDAFGVTERDLRAASAGPRLRALLGFETGRAAELIDSGAPIVATLRGAARCAVAGYVAGGKATVAAVRACGYDVLRATPRRRSARMAVELVRCLAMPPRTREAMG